MIFKVLTAVGHRVVHGGDRYDEPIEIDGAFLENLRLLEPLAPLHLPANRMLIELCLGEFSEAKHVACFDTAFHRSIPAVGRNYALPPEMTKAGLRAYGFHGISYAYVWSVLREDVELAEEKRIIVAHLGAGSSLCAIASGRSVATTMGFSTAEGLPMATRTGSLDPGLIVHLVREYGMSADDLEHLIYREGGLLAVSGASGDMRELKASPDPRAKEAIDLYVYRIVRGIGSLAAATQGLDILVFTGGIGAHDEEVRAAVVERLGWMGSIDVRVIPTDEEAMIARYALDLLKQDQDPQ